MIQALLIVITIALIAVTILVAKVGDLTQAKMQKEHSAWLSENNPMVMTQADMITFLGQTNGKALRRGYSKARWEVAITLLSIFAGVTFFASFLVGF